MAITVFVIAIAPAQVLGKEYLDINEILAEGKKLWLANCEACHGYGIAGAPIPMRSSDWAARIVKDESTLYKNAINGFFGPGDTYMPPRGGNQGLTDTEVKLAVDYMVALARHYFSEQLSTQETSK